jgi:biofilm PGA synthesis N-glycosyltransferase PgaC
MGRQSYVLVTPAFNEEASIERTIVGMVAQTHRPVRWVIVSDGSRDHTDEIVKRYAARHSFIRLFRIPEGHRRNFAAQVNAINAGVAQLKDVNYEFIGNLDADVSMGPEYFDQLLAKFRQDSQLGLGGGVIYEKNRGGEFRIRRTNSMRSVAHAVQLFRRECFESIRAYVPLPYGGADWHAETTARMKGWHVVAFPDLEVFHYRLSSSAGGVLRGSFRQGRMDYSLGCHPTFEIARLIRRVWAKPYVVGALTRWLGFVYCYCYGEKRAVSEEFVNFLRRDQMRRFLNVVPRALHAISAASPRKPRPGCDGGLPDTRDA